MTGLAAIISSMFSLLLIIEFMVVASSSLEQLITINSEATWKIPTRFEMRIISVEERSIVAEMTNLGPNDKSVSSLQSSDLFVTYISQGGVVDEWVGYGMDERGIGWIITSVKTGSYEGELRDPIILPEGDEGVWNVGETIVARITLSQAPNSTYPILIKLVVP